MLKRIITKSEIKAQSLKFVKERFGFHNLKAAEGRDIDLHSHRISFEAGISILLQNLGYKKDKKCYYLSDDEEHKIL